MRELLKLVEAFVQRLGIAPGPIAAATDRQLRAWWADGDGE